MMDQWFSVFVQWHYFSIRLNLTNCSFLFILDGLFCLSWYKNISPDTPPAGNDGSWPKWLATRKPHVENVNNKILSPVNPGETLSPVNSGETLSPVNSGEAPVTC